MFPIAKLEKGPAKPLLVPDRQGVLKSFQFIHVTFADGSQTAAQKIGEEFCCPNCEKFFKAFDALDAIYQAVEKEKGGPGDE